MLDKFKWLGHSSIKYVGDYILYVDPYNIKDELHDADYIFITHNHYDHYSLDDIKKCINDKTVVIVTEDLLNECLERNFNTISVLPNNSYSLDDLSFDTIPAYNVNKKFHPKENKWVGYILNIDSYKYYIAGDTDITDENRKVKCNVAFLPIGGTYTMDYSEAALLVNEISPNVVVPIHYGTIVGSIEDAQKFKSLVNDDIECNFLN